MKAINIYDIEAERIETLCEKHDISEAELMQAILDALDNNEIDLDEYI